MWFVPCQSLVESNFSNQDVDDDKYDTTDNP